MSSTAKLFTTGRSQAVRLPKEFRFQGTEVFIRRNLATGEVVLSPKPTSWQEFFALADHTVIPSDFLADRDDLPAEERDLF
ncbi:type II toxin-antitoxin system VapB family antitoxin [Actimicrobium antarcticum]|uniref:AbrB/MazE/SpoVT family DNA-binding domain-containing protein n=1 Tax=Actimicrobium antarcticum TaxID=1051899 RepID=A0ABP7SGI2_9BURK